MSDEQHIDVLVGLPTHDGTYGWEMMQCLERMVAHSHSKGVVVGKRKMKGTNLGQMRSEIAEYAIEIGAKHLLFVDSDQTFPEHALQQLLARDKAVVGALYVKKYYPFNPIAGIYDEELQRFVSISEFVPDELYDNCDGIGTGFMLIKTELFRKLSKPWFLFWWTGREHAGEDYYFCRKVKQETKELIYLDTSMEIGHIGTAAFGVRNYLSIRRREMEEMKRSAVEDVQAGKEKQIIDQKLKQAVN